MAFNSNFFDPFGDLKSKNKKAFSDDPLDFGYGSDPNGKSAAGKRKGSGGGGDGSGSDNDDHDGSRRRSGSSQSPSPEDDQIDEDWPTAPPIDILDSIKVN